MLTLSNGQYIEARSSKTNISFVVSGNKWSGSVSGGGILSEGFFYSKNKIYTSVGKSEVSLLFANTNQFTDTVLTIWMEGSKMFQGTVVTGGSVSFDGEWKVYNADGIQMLDSGFERITVSTIAPSNPSIGDLWISI